MARIKQYPHYLFVETPSGESTQDANGDWVENSTTRTLLSSCREEKDGRGQEFKAGDGTFHKTTSVIQCPKSCPTVAIGSRVIIANDVDCTNERLSGVVLNCESAQMHVRLWV